MVTHARGFVAHLVFGLAVDTTFEVGWAIAAADPDTYEPPGRKQLSDHVDVIAIGMGPVGEVAASRLLAGGKHVAVIERELIGGECAYWACIPSKSVLHPPEAGNGADRSAGVGGARLDWAEARDYRDYMARHLDDAGQVSSYADHGGPGIARPVTHRVRRRMWKREQQGPGRKRRREGAA